MGIDMKQQPPWVPIVAAFIAAAGAMAICGVPIVARLLDIYLPAPTTIPSQDNSVAGLPTNISVNTVSPDQLPTAPSENAGPATPEASQLERPSSVHVVNGNYYSLPGNWTWVCTGDFSTEVSGSKQVWYDVGVANTGLVLVLRPNSTVKVGGPFEVSAGLDVGDCRPYAQDEREAATLAAIRAQLTGGCGSKCEYVNVIELDSNGNEVSNYWDPQKP